MNNKKKVFAELAPRYWELGYSVIPIEPGTKRPAKEIKNWSGYCNNIPSEATREAWLMRYADYGIGLLLGKEIADGYRIGAIDVDRDEFVAVVEVIIGKSTVAKVGKKGRTFFVRFKGGK